MVSRNGLAGGHVFDFDRGVCVQCGMTRECFDDNGKRGCRGGPSGGTLERMKVPD